MIYNKKKIKEIIDEIKNLVEEYSEYIKVKNCIDTEISDEIIWSKGWIEPFCADYITEINDNTIIPRKLLKKEPKIKEYASEHYMINNTPVYSRFYGDDKVFYEKIFIKKENLIIGVKFDFKDKNLYQLTVDHFDENGRPIEFERFYMDNEGKQKIDSIFYNYYKDIIIKAELIFNLSIDSELRLYNDEIYKDVGLILNPLIEKMNPEIVEIFDFDYSDINKLDSCTRTTFKYGKIINHKWKIKKSIIKSYIECNIKWFGE